MNQSVRRLVVDGQRLNDIFLIANEQYYPYYHIQRMDVVYPFTFGANAGTVAAGYSFSSPSRGDSDDGELAICLGKLTPDHTLNADARRGLEQRVQRTLREIVDSEYNRLISERTEDTATLSNV